MSEPHDTPSRPDMPVTEYDSSGRCADGVGPRRAPTVGLLIETDSYRTRIRSSIPESVDRTGIDTASSAPFADIDVAIVEAGLLPDAPSIDTQGTTVLYLTADASSLSPRVRDVIDDVIRVPIATDALELRVRNGLEDVNRGLVGIDCVPDPTLSVDVVDGRRIVRHANTAFESEFGFDASTLANADLDVLIVPEAANRHTRSLVDRALDGETVERVLRRDTAYGRREFLVRILESRRCDADLWITYSDVTGERCREQQVQVLNRVLRHNLRNDMNVILGNIDRLVADIDDPDVREAGEEIRRAANSLVELGDTASTLRLTWDEIDPTAIDLVEVARRANQEIRREMPAADVDLTAPSRCWVHGDPRLVTAVSELVDNAIEHTPPDVDIELRVERGTEWTSISVIDDGPGLPPSERAVLNGNAETPLDHGSGLGLWIVNWIVSISGGQLEVAVHGTSGTNVTISLPTAGLETS